VLVVPGVFNGGSISSDGGGLLLSRVGRISGIIRQCVGCLTDHRDPSGVLSTPFTSWSPSGSMRWPLGHEDLNDHDQLRHDPLMGVLVGQKDPVGQDRTRERDRGKALAGKSTLNRLELAPPGAGTGSRCKKIVAHQAMIEQLLVKLFLQSHRRKRPPRQIVLDADATDDPIHGNQLGRLFHGYYGNFCYPPLYVFCGEHLLCAKLRPSNIDASLGRVKVLANIVEQIRAAWPKVRIIVREDSGFCRENLMSWCEANGVDFIPGLARNRRLVAAMGCELQEAKEQHEATGQAARLFKDFQYRTRKSWGCRRRVIGKAEHLNKGPNPRFVVTSLPADEVDAGTLYEDHYCARGDTGNRIKEQQLRMFADRTSVAIMRANQLRLWFSSIAYCLMVSLRQRGLQGTAMAQGPMHGHPTQAVQDRRPHPCHCPQRVGCMERQLPVRTSLWPNMDQSGESGSNAVLTRPCNPVLDQPKIAEPTPAIAPPIERYPQRRPPGPGRSRTK